MSFPISERTLPHWRIILCDFLRFAMYYYNTTKYWCDWLTKYPFLLTNQSIGDCRRNQQETKISKVGYFKKSQIIYSMDIFRINNLKINWILLLMDCLIWPKFRNLVEQIYNNGKHRSAKNCILMKKCKIISDIMHSKDI